MDKEEVKKKFKFKDIFILQIVIAVYTLSTVLVILGLRGVPYKNEPIIESLGYIFVMILSNLILGEKITKKKIIGNLLILSGIIIYYL